MADVLIVDDDPDIRAMLNITLEGHGHRVSEAADGTQALLALEKSAPDVMVLDVMMPGVDGFGVLREMRRKGLGADTRVMLVTCKAEERDFVQGWELGADEYLTKPFDPDTLVRKVDELVAASVDALRDRRDQELQKAELLDRLEGVFSRGRRRANA